MRNISEIIVNISSYLISVSMTKELLQIIALVFSILGTLIIAVTRIIDWYQKAKSDGKIDKEEIKELEEIVKEETDKINDKTKGE